ncbi:hypothetical protein KDW_27870 [Dictyobacter vulcani]|uniref:Uncharacterized protein n=1 Tax=Dictyobacter vulcani TaxID=2607529 RepID=A0A5J4KL89_9CHLR|nr:hypothetical protein [Dictyobacter vulcani]GER88625.1 hypothetical protein KDW_27870 [Dictyobacter vulcani]
MSECTYCDHASPPVYAVDQKDEKGQATGQKISVCHTCHSHGHGLGGPAQYVQPTPATRSRTKKPVSEK